jgi:hypothetical protein
LTESTKWSQNRSRGKIALFRNLSTHALSTNLTALIMVTSPQSWTFGYSAESGLTTAAMKLKRKPLQEFYQLDIDRMYGISNIKYYEV